MVCRLVFVKDVQVTSSAAVPLPPAGQTELPTCPVCLERLDEHISGVVTTVSVPPALWPSISTSFAAFLATILALAS